MLLLPPAYLRTFERATPGQKVVWVVPAVQNVRVSLTLVRCMLGWPESSRKGILTEIALGKVVLVRLSCLTERDGTVSTVDRVPLALETSPCTDNRDVLSCTMPVPVRNMLVLPDPFIPPNVLRACMAAC